MKNIILCGCGALGSHIAMGIAHPRDSFLLYDDEKIEEVNVTTGTTIYSGEHVGRWKADTLARILSRKQYTLSAFPVRKTVRHRSIAFFLPDIDSSADLIIDCFDNVEARSFTVGQEVPTIHVSIGEQGLGAIEWNDVFQLPSEGYARGENPVCTNELGRNLILFTSAVASVIINKYLSTGVMESAYVSVDKLEVFR